MIRFMTDVAADITADIAKEMDITVLPFMIHFGEKSIKADENLDYDSFYQTVRESDVIPSTSQMSPADIEELYRKLGAEGDPIIHVTISAKASGINNTSHMVAEQLKDEGFDITIIDSTTFSYPISKVVIEAAQMAKEGREKQEIIDYMTACYKRDNAYFVVDDLTYLQKGGRIKATTMAISKALDIKPILSINDGLVEAYQKVRGLKKAMSVLTGYVEERMDAPEENEVYILHSDAPDKVEILKKQVEEKVNPKAIKVMNIGPIITSHAGLGLVGIYFKHKQSYEK